MPTRLRKIRRLRGSRTHGWGVSGQHRDSGMQGGHGGAGLFKHRKTRLVAEGFVFGKHGFFSHSAREVRAVNLKDLTRFAPESSEKNEGSLPLIDLSRLGYQKLLGEGTLREPFAIRVAKASKSATKKVEEAGGKILPSK